MKLEDVVRDLIQQATDRSGAGFGNYALGLLYAIDALLPFVDANSRGVNGYGEAGLTIAESFIKLRERIGA